MNKNDQDSKPEKKQELSALPKCGIVMPISSIDNCTAEHWSEVLTILRDVITSADFEPNLVSDADDIGIIQKRIIQNLYSNEVVLCDVSCKNPNVMFELGLRLAFDKPTIIIKDDKTDYTFDTSIIEHLGYPRDLRFNKIISFKENLKKKILATHSKATKDPNYSTFLKNFGEYKIAHLTEKEVSSEKFILNTLEELKDQMFQLKRNQYAQTELLTAKTVTKTSNDNKRVEQVKNLINQLINDYMKTKGIKHRIDIMLSNELTEDLFSFILKNKEISMNCGISEARQLMNSFIDPF
jgi:hypothetical protein